MHHVYVGPTLARSEPVLSEPGVRVLPPVRHGDLFDASICDGDTAVIIDGVYHQAPALKHKEILHAMGRGVQVIGAASIGALRAAELDDYGMIGIGTIYTHYINGEISGDDEVAVGQAPDGDQEALTWPLVNVRHVLQLARAAGIMDEARAEQLLAALRGVYYPQRTTAAVRAVCQRQGEAEFAGWLAEQRERDPYFGDLKRLDALAAVRTALRGRGPTGAPPAPTTWDSPYFWGWSNHFARHVVDGLELPTQMRVIYQQVFDEDFRERWADFLDHRSRQPARGGEGLPLPERLQRATGGVLPAHRVFHPKLDLRDEATLTVLLAGETREDRVAVARYADALAVFRRERPGAASVSDDVARQVLLQVWHCQAKTLDAEASARGLISGAYAVETVKRLVPGFLAETREETETTTREAACDGR
ncbi:MULTISPECIES: TfuA-like protein [unclassified Streptomyces]|uniref:TfuA-like protein n=1 Tax=unclassified Streptomyces TaxID=2593676 RepID=UPI0023652D35|nr:MULTISPECIES: TfuA-like protein [unclassified Streptomyces]MDF3144173.1 TfuA-like protein [Streptomyces sp. T21Q-yed]WDF45073.1 TfuA-like protein [Streptomyces sp. T12]